MALDKTISGLIEAQLPDFINAKYQAGAPSFRRFIELYYEWLEVNSTTGISNTAGNTIYHIMNSEKYRDIDNTEEGFLTYFKSELLPYFPERGELELTKILKGAKEFYQKKGTEQSIKWLFRVLFNKEANVFYPKDDILRASDGKWQLPKSIKVSDSPFVVQTAASTKNYYAANLAISGYHSNNAFQTSAEFSNSLRKNSTLIGFASYKIWVDTSLGLSTLDELVYYVQDNSVHGKMYDSSGTQFTPIELPVMSYGISGYGKKVLYVLEAFYSQEITSSAKVISYNPTLTKETIKSILNLDPGDTVDIQYDGLRLFELGNLEIDSLIDSNSVFVEATTSSDLLLTIDSANTPAYIFSFGKEELGTTLLSDSANTATIANTSFGDDKYLLQYTKKYTSDNVFTYVNSTSAANIATISFAFKEKPRANTELLSRKRVTGLTSKATAVVEKVYTKVDEYTKSLYTELFLSDIRGEFINNELIEIEFVDNDGLSRVFTERIFGFVGSVTIDPNRKGLNYEVNDPVIIFGGTDGTDATSVSGFQRATAYVSNVTSGRIVSLSLTNGGFGYRADPNTTIAVTNHPSNPEGVEGNITIGSVDTANGITLSLATDTIQPYATDTLSQAGGWGLPSVPTANITTGQSLSALFQFTNFDFYPISSLLLQNGGHDYSVAPTLTFNTVFQIDGSTNTPIESLGLIANVAVLAGGSGYTTGQAVNFSGSGIGASATIVASGGAVTGVNFASQSARGFGYTNGTTVATIAGAGTGAVLKVYGFNDGAEVTLSVDDVGKVNQITVDNMGFGYSSTPLASLKVLDVYVTSLGSSIQSGQSLVAYQGSNLATATFTANVDTYYTATNANNTIRLYDYNGAFSTISTLKIDGVATYTVTGYHIYGNGLARANVNFVDGTVTYPGYFLNTDGFLSADKKIQDGTKYHNYSYVIESEKPLKDYKQTFMNIVHPAGTRMIAHTKIPNNHDAVKDIILKTFKVDANTGNINAGPMLFATYYNGSNANITLGTANTSNITSNAVSTTNFSTLAIQAGDRIILNYANTDRAVTLTVSSVTSSTKLNTTQPVVIPGTGLLSLNSSSVYATCTENVAGKIVVNDYLRIFDKFDFDETGTDTHVIVRRVATSPVNNIIQLASAPPISNTGLGYWIDPDFRNTPFKVERNV